MKGFIVVGTVNRALMLDPDKSHVAIIDYGMGNLFNVERACSAVGVRSVITADKDVISRSCGMILPGVGAFGDAINNLKKLDLIGVIKDHIGLNKPFFGICLGMQLLLSESDEFGGHKGLDVIPGRVVRFNNQDEKGGMVKVPQVGWNQIHVKEGYSGQKKDGFLLRDVSNCEYMYFVHSYYAVPEDPGIVLATTRYENTEYCSAFLKGSIFAVQFHPEKSGIEGLKIYKNWAHIIHAYEELAKR